MSAREVNFDGLPGQTHHYAGLAFGNEASARNQYRVANPKLAALQGLMKMKALADLGYAQGVIPPHERPNLAVLRQQLQRWRCPAPCAGCEAGSAVAQRRQLGFGDVGG